MNAISLVLQSQACNYEMIMIHDHLHGIDKLLHLGLITPSECFARRNQVPSASRGHNSFYLGK